MTRTRRLAAAALCLALAGAGAAGAGELVIEAKDFPVDVGRRASYQIANAEGQQVAQVRAAIVGQRRLGDVTLAREAVLFGTMRVPDGWIAVGPDRVALYPSFGAELPTWACPMPLKAGKTYEYEAATGPVRGRVEGPETIEVPAGRFTCLVWTERRQEDGVERVRKNWIAPGVGTVKALIGGAADQTLSLVSHEKPQAAKPKPGVMVLSTFDTGNPLVPLPFPRAAWSGVTGLPGATSVVDIEPWGGAAGTPFCLKWAYATAATWVSANIVPSGDVEKPVDLSGHGGASFYIKGLLERPCAVSIQAKAADRDERIMIHIPIQVTAEWRKVTLSPDTHPQLRGIDFRQVYILGLGDHSQEPAGNVIWLDEVMLHPPDDKGEF